MMDQLIADFTAQLHEALKIANESKLTIKPGSYRNVMITGLGGSGIGGTIVMELAAESGSIPVLVNKDYFLPAFVGADSLVVASSYSGNTEETIQALHEASGRGAKIVCVSSGGAIADMAREKNFDLILVPSGKPPRACLAYSLTQLIHILCVAEVLPESSMEDLSKAAQLLDAEEKAIQEEAMAVARKLSKKIPVIYAVAGYEGVAIRLRQQINENSKMLCWHHVIPEMNHNELVGWTTPNEDIAVIYLRNADEYSRNKARVDINKDVISKYAESITEVWSKGSTRLQRMLYHIHLGDWISWYLADLQKIDAMEVKVIDHLKSSLAKI